MKSNLDLKPDVFPERRKTIKLLQYWEEIRGLRALPMESDIDPDAIEAIWDDCFLLQTRDLGRSDGNFTYLGKNIILAFRGGYSGDACGELISPNVTSLGQNFTHLLETGEPQLQEGSFRNIKHDLVRFRQCLVPLGNQKVSVDAIFGCMSLKIFPEE
jgi:hypothetical protein